MGSSQRKRGANSSDEIYPLLSSFLETPLRRNAAFVFFDNILVLVNNGVECLGTPATLRRASLCFEVLATYRFHVRWVAARTGVSVRWMPGWFPRRGGGVRYRERLTEGRRHRFGSRSLFGRRCRFAPPTHDAFFPAPPPPPKPRTQAHTPL